MGFIFFIPLVLIAFHESSFDNRKYLWMENWFIGDNEGSQNSPENRNPQVNDPHCVGLEISKVPFDELIKAFPKTDQVKKKTFLYSHLSLKWLLTYIFFVLSVE